MNRRCFLRYASLLPVFGLRVPEPATGPEVAFTFDDPRTEGAANLGWQELNERILATLAKYKVKAALFVCGKRVDTPSGRRLIAAWDAQRHLIGNHSYSHLYFHGNSGTDGGELRTVTLGEFEADTVKNEPLIRGCHHFAKLFRYPFFKEGDTIEKRDGMRAFLKARGYRIGRATIDTSDWAISARLEEKARVNPGTDLTGYRDYFLQHISERAEFYDSLARRALGRPVRHTVLLHHNALNALYLDDLLSALLRKGWTLVDAEHAYQDPLYDRQPDILPAGESLIWALAKESGKFEKELRYPGEDDGYENPRMNALGL
jgi:peptidoglycan-N-acetylglucosamine deacetylase